MNKLNLPPCPEWFLNHLKKPTKNHTKDVSGGELKSREIKKIQDALSHIHNDNYQDWLMSGMAINSRDSGEVGFKLWCDWSQSSKKFDLETQRAKWLTFNPEGALTIKSLYDLAQKNGWRLTKKTSEEINAEFEATDILTRYVFISATNKFFDRVSCEELTRDGLDGSIWHQFPDMKPSTYLLKSVKTKKADTYTYEPGIQENPIVKDGIKMWNTWRPGTLLIPDYADKYDIDRWLELLVHLIPSYEEREHFLNWLAFTLQFPSTKINHAIYWGGKQRIGKDLLLRILREGLGINNISDVQAEALSDKFMDFLVHKKLVIVQEMMFKETGFSSRQIENKMKVYLASPPEFLEINRKTLRAIRIKNIVQFIFMTNHKDALHLTPGDGRYYCIWSDAEPLSSQFYTDLSQWYDNGGVGLVVRWLLDRDVSHFEPKKPAPDTSFKFELKETSKDSLQEKLEDMVNAFDKPFEIDIVRTKDIEQCLLFKHRTREISNTLKAMGCIAKECRRGDNERERYQLYAVRDCDTWNEKPPREWLDCYDSRKKQAETSSASASSGYTSALPFS